MSAAIALVRQEDANGCVVAAAAMLLDVSYAEAKALVHPWHRPGEKGIDIRMVDDLLTERGYAVARRHEHFHALACHRADWPPTPWAERHLCEVISLSNSGSHAVVMLGDGRVLDPWWGEIETLTRYPRVLSVASVHRVAPSPIAEAILSPDDPRRRPPTVCMCQEAWS